MDHGHPLRLGTFITPSAAHPERVVALAQISEDAGFDLVTFQDHPYQSAFLDTWTLLTYVAAETERVHLSPNVLNLPLRPAPVTARAAASLDLLSGGRLELGIGAGGFWDAIAAMGGRRLSIAESIDALREGIGVIRDLWDVDARGPVRGGEHYPVAGAKRGPEPAHRIPIHVGAYKPRMLRLTGEVGDGWLPSLPYLQPGDVAAGNARIDAAATAVGRDPSEIQRLLNIRGDEPLDELVRLALEDGVSTFIVMGDDERVLRGFAEGTGAALRETVAAARAAAGTRAPGRSAVALAARREGIAYDELPESLRDRAIEPGDVGYARVRSGAMRGGSPGLVLQPRTVEEVVDAVAVARAHPHVPLGVRSGGHGISGRSTNDGGLVIDVGALDAIEVVDEAERIVRIGPGARWVEVAAALAPHGWAISSGDYGGVGVGGLATAGGVGFLGREHGLTIDNVVGAEVVLADGSVVRASATERPELLWAIRGAGANVGIVTSFDIRAAEVGQVGFAQLAFQVDDVARWLEAFGATMEATPRDTTLFAILGRGRPGEPAIAQVMGVVDSADPDTILERLNAFAALAPLVSQQVTLATYDQVMAAFEGEHRGVGEPTFRSALVRSLGGEVARRSAALVGSGSAPWFQIRSMGGAIGDLAPDETAFAHRDAGFSITAIGRSGTFDALWRDLEEVSEGLYLSFEQRTDPALLERAFPPPTLARLRAIKTEVDPTGLFRDNFFVGVPAASASDATASGSTRAA
ncbi:LLM class flavin-dependent oxidoreductase [Agrococcus sp. SGAir0287]|uniref:LLM class flavin-dependent oxidoreductase n=1 Tax=Agrococcus sp. SGAir0287 TaxID=2070347 RepID=UPI0010CD3B62|nr:LLM class flavin-dependent oxidoreductase [Agrococcus sp. SGAir0287]QCR18987.1 FAD-linked oxidase [Agrococcus sp. SGAir0287]